MAAERKTQGISTPVHVQNVVQPIYSSIITAAEEAAGLEYKPGIEGILENFWILRDMGYLPRIDMDILPLLDSPTPAPTPESGSALPTEQTFPLLVMQTGGATPTAHPYRQTAHHAQPRHPTLPAPR